MPIRTNRGRAAVYRSLWGWPMRSPRHLVASIVIFGVIVVALGVIVPRVMDRKPAAQTGAVGSSTSVQPTQVGQLPSSGVSLPTKLPPPTNSAPAAPPAADAQLTADLWAEAWIRPPKDGDVNKWLKELEEWTTPEFLAQMATIDPKNAPTTVEKVKPVKSTTSQIDFETKTSLGTVRITVIKVTSLNKWLVNGYTKVD